MHAFTWIMSSGKMLTLISAVAYLAIYCPFTRFILFRQIFLGTYSQTFPVFSIALKQIHDATICNVYVAKMHL